MNNSWRMPGRLYGDQVEALQLFRASTSKGGVGRMTNEDQYSITSRPALHSLVCSWLSPKSQPVWVYLDVEGTKRIPNLPQIYDGRWSLCVYVHELRHDRAFDHVWFEGRAESQIDTGPHKQVVVLGMLDMKREDKSWLIVPDELCPSIPDEPSGGLSPQYRALTNAIELGRMLHGSSLISEMIARRAIIDTLQPAKPA